MWSSLHKVGLPLLLLLDQVKSGPKQLAEKRLDWIRALFNGEMSLRDKGQPPDFWLLAYMELKSPPISHGLESDFKEGRKLRKSCLKDNELWAYTEVRWKETFEGKCRQR